MFKVDTHNSINMSQKSITSFLIKRPSTDASNSPKRQCVTPTKADLSREQCDKDKEDDFQTPSLYISPTININTVIANTIKRGAFALHPNIGTTWFRALQAEFNKDYFRKLSNFIHSQRNSNQIFPPEDMVYTWTHHHDIRATRVVIIGQDPYHGYKQAHGLSFSVQKGIPKPPSLINIFKELEDDVKGFTSPTHGDLTGWANQGVLMLNACLTVNAGKPNSHANQGWETFTDQVISWLSKNLKGPIVFLLWGSYAQKKRSLIGARHKVLNAVHPSPLSAYRGFFGCKHFSKANDILRTAGLPEIDWKKLD